MNDQNPPTEDPTEDIVLRHEPDESSPVPVVAPVRNPAASGRRLGWLLGVALIGMAAIGVWYWQDQKLSNAPMREPAVLPGDAELLPGPTQSGPSALADVPETDPSAAREAEAAASMPPDALDPETPLPVLSARDAAALAALAELGAGQALLGLLVDEALLTRLVVTVDNLPARKFGLRQRVLRKVEGTFLVGGSGEALAMAPANATRYAPFVDALVALPMPALVSTYRRFYPLLQEAYAGLGYADRQFHARVLEVIDHLLATPSPDEPVKLVQPKVFYRYADGGLEGASVGRRALYRLGSPQRQAVLEWLKSLRGALVQGTP